MKRKQLKIDWQYDTIPRVLDADVAIPSRSPDFLWLEKSYWFNEMRCLATDRRGLTQQQHLTCWVMDECPRTGAIMVLNPLNGSWFIQPKKVLEAYHTWLAEHFFME